MNPSTVVNQVIWCAVFGGVVAVPASPGLRAFLLATFAVLFLWWLAFKTEYWWRARGVGRTIDRFAGDRAVGLAFPASTCGVALVVALLHVLGVRDSSHWGWRAWHVVDSAPAVVVVLLAAVAASSTIDWYFVRPRRDGIVTLPVCFPATRESRRRRMRLTKWLLWHRSLTTLAWGIGMAFVIFYAFDEIGRFIPSHSIWRRFVEELDAPLSLAVIGLAGWSRGLLGAIPALAGRATLVFGDTVRVGSSPADTYDGFVYEVSLEGPTIMTGGHPTRPTKQLDDPMIQTLEPEDETTAVRCPRPAPAGSDEPGACGGLDEHGKCQWSRHRWTDSNYVDVPHEQRPVRLFSAW